METALTQKIKKRLRDFRPAYRSNMRTIRWAEEVQTATGFVDVIRFEDYIQQDDSYCVRLTPREEDRQGPAVDLTALVGCKNNGMIFPCKNCHGCVYKRNSYTLGILTTCYEVKVTVADMRSGNGHNFHGNRNYYAVPVDMAVQAAEIAPPGIGIIAYYPNSGHMTVKRECEYREITTDDLSYLLYAALKKWVDGKHETKRRLEHGREQ